MGAVVTAPKGYVVRGTHRRGWPVFAYDHSGAFGGPSETDIPLHVFPSLDTASGARAHMVRCGCTDVAIFRVHADGREERLPSYEEALGELERLRAVEALNVGAIDASLTRLGAVTGTIGPMPRHDPRCLIHDGAGCSFEAGCDAGRALMPPSDPLAALEAALSAMAAAIVERRRLAAKGGA